MPRWPALGPCRGSICAAPARKAYTAMDHSSHMQFDPGNDWEANDPSALEAHGVARRPDVPRAVDMEPGSAAARALMSVSSDELLTIMLRPSFRPVKDLDLVPIAPCPRCLDGGLRTAGSVRTRRGRELVRACDTCAAVVLGEPILDA